MNGHVDVSQQALLGAGNTQIGVQNNVQNNYYVMDANEVKRIAQEIFDENFPRLTQIAAETANKRAAELVQTTIQRIQQGKAGDFSPFADPDVQFVFWEAQKSYARLGANEHLEILSSLLANRIEFNSDNYIKIVIDRALSVAPYLNQSQLDYLSLLFLCKRFYLPSMHSLDDLEWFLTTIDNMFFPCSLAGVSLLESLGCLELRIGHAFDFLADAYHFPKEQVKRLCSPKIADLDSDRGPSHVGIVLAITHISNKSTWNFDITKWIKC